MSAQPINLADHRARRVRAGQPVPDFSHPLVPPALPTLRQRTAGYLQTFGLISALLLAPAAGIALGHWLGSRH